MDALIAAAARLLATGDVLGALDRIALREDPPALALRGIAMAQLGEFTRARELLRRAARRFGTHETIARARCVVADAEVGLAMRDLGGGPRALSLAAATTTLAAQGDLANAQQGRLIATRRLLLLGRLDEAATALSRLDSRGLTPALAATAQLIAAEIALRSLRIPAARAALARARVSAEHAAIPALVAEVAEVCAALDRPAARRRRARGDESLRLEEVVKLLASGTFVVDACRRGLRVGDAWVPLARRPVLFSLLRELAQAWPEPIDRSILIERAFGFRRADDSHRARLRVEIGRLRALVAPLARIDASARGFGIDPRTPGEVALLIPPIDGEAAALIALLADGAAWSTSALAQALGTSQRTVQRWLSELESQGRVRSIGRARSQRWLAPPIAGFTTILLLPTISPLQ